VGAAASPLLPILLPLVAAGGLLAAVFGDDIVAALGDARAWINDTADTVDNRWGEDIQALIEEAGRTWEVISDGIEDVSETVDAETQFIQNLVRGTFESVVPRVASTGMDNLIQLVSVGLSLLRGDWSGAMDGLENITDNTTALVGDLFDDGMGQARRAADVAGDRIRGRLDDLAGWVDSGWPIRTNLVGVMRDAQKDGTSISDALAGRVRGDLAGLNDWVEGTFGVNLRQGLGGAFNSAVDATGEAISRLNFGPLVSGLDGIAENAEDLIGGLNSLSGVNIDVDIPSFDGLMSRAKDIVGGRSSGGSSGESGSDGGGGGGSSGVTVGTPTSPLTALATGGIVTDATQAIIGEGSESEAVMPLSRLEQFVDRPTGGVTINDLVVNASGRREGREAGEALKRELKRFDI